jgi:hypothetical protein
MLTRAQELINNGWEKQSTHDEPRLSDIVEMYQEIGLEVLLEPFNPDEEPGCSDCMQICSEKYKTIYTRIKS